MKAFRIIAPVALALALAPSVSAWGPLSHTQIALNAMKQSGESIPPDCMGAFLAGCTEADIGAGQGSAGLDNGVSENYLLYHDPVFVDAMTAIANKKGGKEGKLLLARAKGFQAHILADSVAHTGSGYPNQKQLYNNIPISEDYMPNHIGNEFCLDVLAYSQNPVSGSDFSFIDASTLAEVRAEYAKMKGITLPSDTAELDKQIATHRLTVESELSVAKDLTKNNPKRIEEIDAFYSDRNKGVNGNGGLDQAVSQVASVRFGELSKVKTDESLQGRISGGFGDLMGDISRSGSSMAIESAEDLVIQLNNQKVVSGTIQSTINDKVESRNNRLVGNLVLNLLRKDDASFSEIVLTTEKTVQGDSWNDAARLKALKIEEKLLEEKEARAKEAWENRPWWNLWLLITNADQNTYLTLKAQRESVQAEIKNLEGAATTGDSAGSDGSAGSNSSLNSFLNQ